MDNPVKIATVESLYHYLDSLFDQEVDDDTLFASGYIRGFISLAASQFGDEQQSISEELVNAIAKELHEAKKELSPQDSVIVQNFWQQLQSKFND
ncbi:YfcL family protein [Litorilituus lipolyticus]|uniref:YfcL family protein n=1 Tax=Litorilituus lipolyticus TaxID=2491017 RepID=A0A502LHH1_9GAMM|nr:YfcL family protein [Litorilituus lipolyticus]TPH19207.1 hypothetical protein EPA86_00310 [Litorilituus lipolyticus]